MPPSFPNGKSTIIWIYIKKWSGGPFFHEPENKRGSNGPGVQTVWGTVCTRTLKQESEAVWGTVCTRALKQESEAVWETVCTRALKQESEAVWETVCTRTLKQESEAVWETVCTRVLKLESEAVWGSPLSAGHLVIGSDHVVEEKTG